MSNDLFPGIAAIDSPSKVTYSIMIDPSAVAQTQFVDEKKYITNQEALRHIYEYLDNATKYMKKKRLELG